MTVGRLPKTDLAAVRIAATTIGDLLLTAVDRHAERVAVVFPDGRTSYRTLAERALRRARSLIGIGVREGDHVGLLLPTQQDFVEMLFAVSLCGAVAVLLNARYRSSELGYVAENADLRVIVTCAAVEDQVDFVRRLVDTFPTLPDQADPAHLQLPQAEKLRAIVVLGSDTTAGCIGAASFDRAADAIDELEVHRRRLAVSLRSTAIILYTSGTSAAPKGCLITHEAMVRNSINLGRNRWRFTEADRVWSPLPLFHIAAILPLLSIVDSGGTYIGVPHFKPADAVAEIERERATVIFAPFVTFLQQMALEPGFRRADFSSIRLMNSCFAVQPASVSDRYRESMPHVLQVGTYGMTESSGIASTGGGDMEPELGFTRLGMALEGVQFRIVDPATGEDHEPGGQGEILLRGYSLFSGYYRDPQKTADALDPQGWLHTGDIGSIEADGSVMFHGRLKDMLKVGGENVAAAEVESLLNLHPGVKLSQVCGIPDPRYVEVPVAFVERSEGASATEAELIEFCRARISGFKVPRMVRFVEAWPMSASKIQKFRLRDALVDELGLS